MRTRERDSGRSEPMFIKEPCTYCSLEGSDLAENTLAVCSRYIGIEHDLTDVAARFIVQHRDVDGMAGQHVLQLSEHAPREVAQCQLSRRSSR